MSRPGCRDVLDHQHQSVLGHQGRLAHTDFHVVRQQVGERTARRVPRMLHNVEGSRCLVSEHQLLEEDWRATRAMLRNWQRAASKGLSEDQRRQMFVKANTLAAKILGYKVDPKSLREKGEQLAATREDQIIDIHMAAMDNPLGFLYERYVQDARQYNPPTSPVPCDLVLQTSDKRQMVLPVLEINDPYRKIPIRRERTMKFSVPTRMPGLPEQPLVYNEPDSVPFHLAEENYTLPLLERTSRAINRLTRS